MAGLEKVIASYREINFKVPSEITTSYDEQKHAFDVLRNRKSYYQLLLEHYRNSKYNYDFYHFFSESCYFSPLEKSGGVFLCYTTQMIIIRQNNIIL